MEFRNWVIPGILVVALIAVGAWGYVQYQDKQQLEVYLGNKYQESFYKMVDDVENVTSLLGKGVVANGLESLVPNLSDCYNTALGAQEKLNQLPISNATLIETSKFLTQVGDYCKALSIKNLREQEVTDEQRSKLKSLRSQAANLSQSLHDLESRINEGELSWKEMVKGSRRTVDKEDEDLLSNNFKNLKETEEPTPVLIYDGPFSDHINQKEPKGLTGDMINREKARQIVSDFVDYKGNPNLVIKDLEDVKGKIPAFQFSVQPNDNEKNHTTIDVSKKGGHVVMFLNPRKVEQRKISRVEALDQGDEFLASRGYENMVPTYSWIEDETLAVSYAYKQQNVIIYPDLIKLKIAMDNGQIVGFESMGFIMSHTERELPEPKITKAEIQKKLDERFDVESIRLAVIPTPGLHEKFTWEARVNYEEETYLFYYDVETGNEVNILRVIDTPEGTFAK